MVTDPDASVAFYEKYAAMQVVHRRVDTGTHRTVVWLNDRTRPFVIVLIETDRVDAPLRPFAHLGVAAVAGRKSSAYAMKRSATVVCIRVRRTQVIQSAIGLSYRTRTAIPLKFHTDRKLR